MQKKENIEQHYIVGDARNLDLTVAKLSVPKPQLIITSPPYFDLLDYEGNNKQIGYGNKSYGDYLTVVCQILQKAYDISSPNATLWLIADTFKNGDQVKLFPFDIVNELKSLYEITWDLKDIIIWDKGKNLPWHSKGNFKNQHEYILLFSKNKDFKFNIDRVREVADSKKWWKTFPERYNPDGKTPSNIWAFNTPMRGWGENKQNHLCPFPFQLVEKIISIGTDENDWILDPFAGSGGVLAIAKEMKRNSIGIDINKKFKRRFMSDVLDGASSYWKKRVQELEEADSALANFKSLNQKLRKLKVANMVCEHISKINNYNFICFALNKPKNEVEIVVLENGQIPAINMDNDELLSLIKQAKVIATLSTAKDETFFEENNKVKTYKYKIGKFTSYVASCRVKNIANSATKYDYMYSDIEVKLNTL